MNNDRVETVTLYYIAALRNTDLNEHRPRLGEGGSEARSTEWDNAAPLRTSLILMSMYH